MINHPNRLPFSARQGIMFHQFDLGGNQQFAFQSIGNALLQVFQESKLFLEKVLLNFHLD